MLVTLTGSRKLDPGYCRESDLSESPPYSSKVFFVSRVGACLVFCLPACRASYFIRLRTRQRMTRGRVWFADTVKNRTCLLLTLVLWWRTQSRHVQPPLRLFLKLCEGC